MGSESAGWARLVLVRGEHVGGELSCAGIEGEGDRLAQCWEIVIVL